MTYALITSSVDYNNALPLKVSWNYRWRWILCTVLSTLMELL